MKISIAGNSVSGNSSGGASGIINETDPIYILEKSTTAILNNLETTGSLTINDIARITTKAKIESHDGKLYLLISDDNFLTTRIVRLLDNIDDLRIIENNLALTNQRIDLIPQLYNETYVVETHSEMLLLPAIELQETDMCFVIEDETQSSSTTIYRYMNNVWVFVAKLAIKIRDFKVDKIDIDTETIGEFLEGRIPNTIARTSQLPIGGQVIGVTGTIERKTTTAASWGKFKLIPTAGRLTDINANGEWVCPENGSYTLSSYFGNMTNSNDVISTFQLNSNTVASYPAMKGFTKVMSDAIASPNNCVLTLQKGDNISLWLKTSTVQVLVDTNANFSIILNSSIELTIEDAYKTWQSEDPINNVESMSEWVGSTLNQDLNKVIIGVNGTIERKALTANAWNKVKFIPTDGDISNINSSGEWVCPYNGYYSFNACFGSVTASANNTALFSLNSPNSVVGQVAWGSTSTVTSGFMPSTSFKRKMVAGDNISFWVWSTVAQTQNNYESNFIIKLDNSINITVQNAYDAWKLQDSINNTASFDEWISDKLRQSTIRCGGTFVNSSISAGGYIIPNANVLTGDSTLVSGNKFIAKKSGLYTLSIGGGYCSAAGTNFSYIIKNSTTINNIPSYLAVNNAASTSGIPFISTTTWLEKDEYLTHQIYSSVAQTNINSSASNHKFEFALIGTGEVSIIGAWEDWKKIDPINNILSFDDWISEKLKKSLPEYIYNTDISASTNTTSFGTGEEGVLFCTHETPSTSFVYKRCMASRSLKNSTITLQYHIATMPESCWNNANEFVGVTQASTYRYGMGWTFVIGSDEKVIDVGFGGYGLNPTGATYASPSLTTWKSWNALGYKWRVRIDY